MIIMIRPYYIIHISGIIYMYKSIGEKYSKDYIYKRYIMDAHIFITDLDLLFTKYELWIYNNNREPAIITV
jgi:hypothetical protein